MAVEVRKRKSENVGSLLFRFNKRIKQSGILKEAKKRRSRSRSANRRKVKQSALYKQKRQLELAMARKYGLESQNK